MLGDLARVMNDNCYIIPIELFKEICMSKHVCYEWSFDAIKKIQRNILIVYAISKIPRRVFEGAAASAVPF
jgi:hypothetical protein